MSRMRRRIDSAGLAFAVAAFGSGACTPGWLGAPPPQPAPQPASASVATTTSSFRIVQSSTNAPVHFADLVTAAATADVVFFGEQHDDPETHFAEFALLEAIGHRRTRVVLSLEMFERDVQPVLNDYLAGRISEVDFVAKSRPWPRYETDYRPLVILARARGWPVIAANVPRPIASAVSKGGLSAIDTLSRDARSWAAASFMCVHDAYYTRFAREMTGHSAGGGPPTATDPAQMLQMTDRFFEAQCVKDETMAESISEAVARDESTGTRIGSESEPIVVHFTGSFHSDYRQGTVQRTLRRRPGLRTFVITAIPSTDPATEPLGDADVPRGLRDHHEERSHAAAITPEIGGGWLSASLFSVDIASERRQAGRA